MIILRKIAYIMIGIPGSGKSTWIKNNLPGDMNIISKDQIRIDLGIMDGTKKAIGTKEEETKVEHIYGILLDKAINSGKPFVIDNINLGRKLEETIQKIKDSGYKVVGIRINTPLQVCIQRRPEIPKKVLGDMNKKIELINPKLFDKFINI